MVRLSIRFHTTRLCNSPTRRQTDRDGTLQPRTTTTAVYHVGRVWALPFSLPFSQGVEVFFPFLWVLRCFSSPTHSTCPMYSGRSTRALPRVSFLIRRSRDQRSVSTSPGLIAAAHVLHRLLAPRHPPCALVLLIRKEHVDVAMEFQGARELASASPFTKAAPKGLGRLSSSVRPALGRTDT